MNIWRQLIVCMAFCLCPALAHAGAWPQPLRNTQLIVSYEPAQASQGFDGAGKQTLALNRWRQDTLSVFADHGVSRRFTVTAKLNFQNYQVENMKFSGLGSVELGGRWTLRRTSHCVFALGASVEGLGKGRRDEFDTAIKRGTDYDLRAWFGRSFKLGKADAFIDLQAARHLRQYNPNQWRVDATLGVKPSAKLMLMAQIFSGQTDRVSGMRSQWTQGQLSLVRNIAPKTAVQIAYRQMIAGRNVPATKTLIVSLWRNF